MWQFHSPEIIFGEEALSRLEQLQGRRVFIVTDAVIAGLGLVEQVTRRLNGMQESTTVFTEVEPEPSLETIRRGADAMRAHQPDWIIGLGGGSVLDAAKAMRILYERPDLAPEAINPFEPLGLGQKAKLICIPTTAGTGAEITAGAVLKDTAAQRKIEVASYEAVPDLAIIDPQLTAHLPGALTADTGLDVLTHAVEGYACTWANDFSDGLCLQAARLVFVYLPRAVTHGANDPEAREKMANAAAIAGLGMGNSHIALAHALGHSAGALFSIPHGRITGLFLPYTIEFTANAGLGRYLDLARMLGLPTRDEAEAARRLAEAIRQLMQSIQLPLTLAEAGISPPAVEAELDGLCERAELDAALITALRVPSHEELQRLFRHASDGRPVDF
jgi:alcohol dehydrogenase class IV